MIDTTLPANRAFLVKQICREQKRVDQWRADLEKHPDSAFSATGLAAAQDAIVKYVQILAEGER